MQTRKMQEENKKKIQIDVEWRRNVEKNERHRKKSPKPRKRETRQT